MTALLGLVLAGGRSTRMGADKAALEYTGRPQLAAAFDRVSRHVDLAFVSVRPEQAQDPLRAAYPQVRDGPVGRGPVAGIVAAQALHPEAAWLVVACDLPLLDDATLIELVVRRDRSRLATAFASRFDGLPEPLCAIYEPGSRAAIVGFLSGGRDCPRKFLATHDICLLPPRPGAALDNANTPADAAALRPAPAPHGAA